MTAAAVPVSATAAQESWIRRHLYLGYTGLAIGGLFGILQAFERLGVDLYDEVGAASYYQGLTLHGVTLVIVFTFTFANAFSSLVVMRSLGRRLASDALNVGAYVASALGLLLAAVAMLANQATVLFTFYTPLQAVPYFYVGAALLLIGTWLVALNLGLTVKGWRRDHPGERIPLPAYASLVTYLMWFLASLGLAIEVLVFVLPWSLGLVERTDPLTNRTLFWLTGHPIVYFWLLPAYTAWYTMITKRNGGKLYSDGLVRVVFLMFLLFSTPVGLHHQFTDPGVDSGLKFVHAIFTYILFVPSMITAFTLMASFEGAGRAKGGRGLFGWIPKLAWRDPVAVAAMLGMIAFLFGGASGLINASYTVNLVVHNTSFVPGHFHLTVGAAVALTFMGLAYLLIPMLTGKPLYRRGLALAQSWLYLAGVLIFSRGQIAGGLEGMPRRTAIASAPYLQESWEIPNILTGFGGLLMAVSGVLFFAVVIGTLLGWGRGEVDDDMSFVESIHGPDRTPALLDRLGLWFAIALILVLLAYVPVFLIEGYQPLSPGFSTLY